MRAAAVIVVTALTLAACGERAEKAAPTPAARRTGMNPAVGRPPATRSC
jgi:hypothetical protein